MPVYTDSSADFNDLIIHTLSQGQYVDVVEIAARRLLEYVSPASPKYLSPKRKPTSELDLLCNIIHGPYSEVDSSSSEMKRLAVAISQHTPMRSEIGPLFNIVYDFAKLVTARAQAQQQIHLIGVSKATYVMVYSAIVTHHQWRVNSILEDHAINGRNFGSATAFQRECLLNPILGWPRLFDFPAAVFDKRLPYQMYEDEEKEKAE